MTIKMYDKMVRTRIPKIIKQKGNIPDWKKITNADFKEKIFKEKLQEELGEVLEAKSQDELIEELADLTQVIMDYARLHGFDNEDLETVRKAKVIKCGNFDHWDPIYLKSVQNN